MNHITFMSFLMISAFYSSISFAGETSNKESTVYSDRTMMTATGKQRLSKKWQDETRVDDCKVPEQYRTDKSRSSNCDKRKKLVSDHQD